MVRKKKKQEQPETTPAHEDTTACLLAFDTLSKMEADMISQHKFSESRRRMTTVIVRSIALLVMIVAGFNMVLLLELHGSLIKTVNLVEEMNNHFFNVSISMREVTRDAITMEQNMRTMPLIATDMEVMQSELIDINRSVGSVANGMGHVNSKLAGMEPDVGHMAGRVGHINSTVHNMTGDMHRMSKPSRWMNSLFPW